MVTTRARSVFPSLNPNFHFFRLSSNATYNPAFFALSSLRAAWFFSFIVPPIGLVFKWRSFTKRPCLLRTTYIGSTAVRWRFAHRLSGFPSAGGIAQTLPAVRRVRTRRETPAARQRAGPIAASPDHSSDSDRRRSRRPIRVEIFRRSNSLSALPPRLPADRPQNPSATAGERLHQCWRDTDVHPMRSRRPAPSESHVTASMLRSYRRRHTLESNSQIRDDAIRATPAARHYPARAAPGTPICRRWRSEVRNPHATECFRSNARPWRESAIPNRRERQRR